MSYKYIQRLFAILLLFIIYSNSLLAGVYEYTFSDNAFGKVPNTVRLGELNWTASVTIDGKPDYADTGFTSKYGQKFSRGESKVLFNPLMLSTDGISKTITAVTITTSVDKSNYADCSVSVGESEFLYNNRNSCTLSNHSTSYKFEGKAKGKVCIKWKQTRGSGQQNPPIYIKKIRIEYKDNDKPEQQISFPYSEYVANIEDEFKSPLATDALTAVTYTSSNTDVATVDATTGKVDLKKLGTTVITATAEETESYNSATVSYTLHVKSKYEHTTTFNFQSPSEFGVVFKPTTYIPINSIYSKDIILSANAENNFHKDSKNKIRFKLYSGGEMTLSAPNGMLIKSIQFQGDNPQDLKSGGQSHDDAYWEVEAPSITFTADKVVALTSATVEYKGTYHLPIGKVGYSTFAAAQAYMLPDGIDGGIVTVNNNTANIRFCYHPGDIVPAKEPLVLKGAPKTYELAPSFTLQSPKAENKLKQAYTNDSIKAKAEHELFILSLSTAGDLGFYYQKGCKDGSFLHDIAHKAYMELSSSLFSGNNHGLRLYIEPTGITTPIIKESPKGIYNLSGKKISEDSPLSKGLYIINGKKTFIK